MRDETRRERYNNKAESSIQLPVSFVTINFEISDNIAFLIRTAACYGATQVNVIGSIPPRSYLNPRSGSLYDYVTIRQFSRPSDFLRYSREMNLDLVTAEIGASAVSLYDFEFNFSKHTAIVLGHETTGIPPEITFASKQVYIPMPGVGFCLNTSQTGTAMITEYSRQYFNR